MCVSSVCNLRAQKVAHIPRELISRTIATPALWGAEAARPPSCLPQRRKGGSNNPSGWKLRNPRLEEEGKVACTAALAAGNKWHSLKSRLLLFPFLDR